MKVQISLAAARVNAEMTQDYAANQLGINKATLISWEKGRTEPKLRQAKALAELYGIPYDYIFFGKHLT